jgi:hypothetical protein
VQLVGFIIRMKQVTFQDCLFTTKCQWENNISETQYVSEVTSEQRETVKIVGQKRKDCDGKVKLVVSYYN